MRVRPRLDLVLGPCRWETTARQLLAVACAAALLTASAGWGWKLAMLAALAGAWAAARDRTRGTEPATLTVHPDGTATLREAGAEKPVTISGRSWLSRLFCLVEWNAPDDGRRGWAQVCATRNDPADYRRFVGLLRLGVFEQGPRRG